MILFEYYVLLKERVSALRSKINIYINIDVARPPHASMLALACFSRCALKLAPLRQTVHTRDLSIHSFMTVQHLLG